MNGKVYMDYAATTFVRPEVVSAMMSYHSISFENPSSLYSYSNGNRRAIEEAREAVADLIGALSEEIFFTGGGSEADNWALKGLAFSQAGKDKRHLITTETEHHAVLHSMEFLERMGFRVTYLPVDSEGFVPIDKLKEAIRDDTLLVSVAFANNEIGTIQDVEAIVEVCRDRGVLFHTDAVQAAAHVPIDVKSMGIDMLSMAAHKFYGPKGVGALYVKKGIRLENLIHGGGQERSRRAGTENVASIVGMGKAASLASEEMEFDSLEICKLRDRLIDGVMSTIPHARLNGPVGDRRLPNNANFSFVGIEGETLLLDLDDAGIAVSTGSACASASLDPSHVLMAIGLSHEMAHGSVRLTLGRSSSDDDVSRVLEVLPYIVERRRAMSPLWDDYVARREVL
ncbi:MULTISPECIES: cysteine desulfurase NifS [Dethiosulfovibrio]|uniref:Cysteine desulfurase IscS n=2 Tax=Dethiosulfovibrio TaxID=47054 RepID=A0ABS9EL38_9BACT|nr:MULTISPECIES: cysteine desulfurase NifS [Dethiosulfovibrio]MCF4112935.1 cysteine desulfurase NifS [Dethiosulfovibrio russensis]MCF4141399.1 cysteine desulfurase NifS [Dethiosulfovibrio marinus]MCF4144354.1 cysteine desulfurase NifS [Dethiosulfovibrio acidaminovorans]